jgi:hypothetical protein
MGVTHRPRYFRWVRVCNVARRPKCTLDTSTDYEAADNVEISE